MKYLAALAPDALIVAGAFCIATGAALLHPAAGLLVGGALLMGLGYLAAKR